MQPGRKEAMPNVRSSIIMIKEFQMWLKGAEGRQVYKRGSFFVEFLLFLCNKLTNYLLKYVGTK